MATKIADLIDEVLEAHGSRTAWQSYDELASTIVTGGVLWQAKQQPLTPEPHRVRTKLHNQWTSISNFGSPDYQMIWTPERVEVQDNTGNVLSAVYSPRLTFAGHQWDTPWDVHQVGHFQGYAMWTYHNLPFLLTHPQVEVTPIASVIEDEFELRGLQARFPAMLQTHSEEQSFYFGPNSLLYRHDYEVDILGKSKAAHYLSDYVVVDGFHLPTRRRVHRRLPDGTVDKSLSLVTIDLSDYLLS